MIASASKLRQASWSKRWQVRISSGRSWFLATALDLWLQEGFTRGRSLYEIHIDDIVVGLDVGL